MMLALRCECGAEETRSARPVERAYLGRGFSRAKDVHRVWHPFEKALEAAGDDRTKQRNVLDRFARKHPGVVRTSHCDDSHFSNSALLFLVHESREAFMGASVVFFPQCSPEPARPVGFFLYPSDVEQLEAICRWLRRKAKVGKTREEKAEARWRKRLAEEERRFVK